MIPVVVNKFGIGMYHVLCILRWDTCGPAEQGRNCEVKYYWDFFVEMHSSGGPFLESKGWPAGRIGQFFTDVFHKVGTPDALFFICVFLGWP